MAVEEPRPLGQTTPPPRQQRQERQTDTHTRTADARTPTQPALLAFIFWKSMVLAVSRRSSKRRLRQRPWGHSGG
jgi:hypothetical protein